MKILADKQMPHVTDYFAGKGEIIFKMGRAICRDDLNNIDILLTRSVTRVDEALLKDTPVKFVGSATGGADHLDTTYLDTHNIAWSVAPGCNAPAVADYVLACVASLQKSGNLSNENAVAGVVGVGHIGSAVVQRLTARGFHVLQNDPIRAAADASFQHTPLSSFSDCDIVCVHTPLTHSGGHSTFHLVNEKLLKQLKPGCVLLNAARGAVVDFSALKKSGAHLTWCLDVWEGEPEIDLDVLGQAWTATPHVAGYALESKQRGTYMIYEAACEAFAWEKPPAFDNETTLYDSSCDWRDAVLSFYDPMKDTRAMKKALLEEGINVAALFDQLRMQYPNRHELPDALRRA